MPIADGPLAHDILLGFEPLSLYGACWYYNWQAMAQAGASTSMGSTPTAYEGWLATSGKHYDMHPPEGALVWLGQRYDGNMDGDVFTAGAVDGDHAATDEPTYGVTGLTSILARMELCGREYLGWTDHVLDCPIKLGNTPNPEPQEIWRANMRTLVSNSESAEWAITYSDGSHERLENGAQVRAQQKIACSERGLSYPADADKTVAVLSGEEFSAMGL